MIDVRHVEFAYEPTGFRLSVPELAINSGERVALVGPSGVGKSTLLNLLAGIVQPMSGRIETDGRELTAMSEAERRNFRIANIGLVFQDFALLEYLTVLDNILLAFRINRSLRLTDEVRRRAHTLAADLGLDGLLHRRPMSLSQGERQRVAVCRALVTAPTLVLADEPTANLDEANALGVLELLNEQVRRLDATMVAVTHDHMIAERLDRTIDVSQFHVQEQRPLAAGALSQ